ncbi:40S ribosomal protein S4 [Encephalitozoon intestinalis ATCC 50506]|uniref:40S ribosomal protein S4 n=1 Tax=Encephalitozoon intestinalis (strain ATCC 50506) TaxID=876142 RepID=E0S8M2_ENCIT|nr:40S ribosomal protein S4 [Encephalitozoon intestinalis ATCC 50506]ADM12016.1 40S ribosomal protein S4 [Encephalitozoon intestinalis ATCC 50506]UTX45804.1 ribosomal protein S4 [Encephalitozoon intestinalis]
MPTGHRDHLKRKTAPKSWMLNKQGGTFAMMPASGPHRKTECIPLGYLISRFLKYSSNSKELRIILDGKNVKVNGKVRTNSHFPVGLFDVVSIEKTGEHFRVLYNVHKKFHLHRINSSEASYRLAKVTKKYESQNVPYVVSSCGLSIRFCDPAIDVGYTIKISNETSKVIEYIEPGVDKVVFVSSGKARGRIGVINTISIQGKEVVYGMTDFAGHTFSCTSKSCILIGESEENILITLPKERGIRLSSLERINAQLGEMVDIGVVEVCE